MIEINTLYKSLVRVNNGSGICLKFEKEQKCYVLTAFHCIKDSIENQEEIELSNDKREFYSIISTPLYDEGKDIALIEIDFMEDVLSITFDHRRILPDAEITFMGYPNKATNNERKRLNGKVIEWNDKTAINIVEDIRGSFIDKERTIEAFSGFSGSAVFMKRSQDLIFIGILKSLPEEDFDYKEITCISIEEIKSFLEKNHIIGSVLTQSNINVIKEKISLNDGNYFEIEMVKVDLPDKSLYVSIYPVTFEKYDFYCDDKRNGDRVNGYIRDNERRKVLPIVNVTWQDAIDFCDWLNSKIKSGEKKKFPLMDSVDWEFIAKENMSTDNIWCGGKHMCKEVGTNFGVKGIFDFLGNIEEICSNKVVKGASFKKSFNTVLDFKRENKITNLPKEDVGFRIVRVDI